MAWDFIIVGSGIAGLRAALALGPSARTLVVTKEAIGESATAYAQGGIAAATGEDDTVALHEQDTLAAGDGLCSAAAVRVLVEDGPAAIEQLLEWGAQFDRDAGGLERAREAAHSRSRILHAHGDSTGREIASTLARRAADLPRLEWRTHARALALVRNGDRIAGVQCAARPGAPGETLLARAVLLATGGLGQLYPLTTNPAGATGDGVAAAWQAGAVLADMEFVQFHPTALALEGAPAFLLSEALRGEGARLRNPAGELFMSRYHPAAELAPRDVVARALVAELASAPAGAACFLDARALGAEALPHRFPRVAATLAGFGLDLGRDLIPVRPAAHYAMGGIWTTLEGRTSVAGLYAAGECACTGVHGANRLASNSLLEGLVFGARAGAAMADEAPLRAQPGKPAPPDPDRPAEADALQQVRATLGADCGLIRTGGGLEQALARLERLGEAPTALTAAAIARAALARAESRGAHFRCDFPRHDAELAGRHSLQQRGAPVRFATF
ncbi:MAG: L-aspartate oxidase [Terriglobales bacterium]